MKKIIITDIDECVLRWHEGFQNFIINKGITPAFDISKCRNLEEWLHDIPNKEVRNYIREFNDSEAFGSLNAGYKSDIYIKLLHDEGYDFIALTSCGEDESTINYRKQNIETLFPNIFKEIICIPLGQSKLPYLTELPKEAIWVEDKFKNASMGVELGHKCFLMNHTHNIDYQEDGIIRVDDWENIYDVIHSIDTINEGL